MRASVNLICWQEKGWREAKKDTFKMIWPRCGGGVIYE